MKPAQFLAALLLFLALASAASAQNKVRINWTAVTGAQSGLFMAKEGGYFEKYGLENVELIHIASSSRGIQGILAGELAMSFMDGLNTVQANLKGANLALVVGATNRMVFSLMAKPEFKRIADLRGKKIGITRAGSSTHTAALYALGSAGLKSGDYQVLPLLEVPNIFTALSAGQIDAGIVSPPTNSRAKKANFVELMNIGRDGPEYVSVALGSSRSYIKSNEDTIKRVVRAYVEALYRFRNDKAAALRMIEKYLKVKEPDIQDDTWSQFREYLAASPPFVSRKGVEAIIAEVAQTDPQAKTAKADDFIDGRFMSELEKEGFLKKLWGK
jgi:NitT/TauT family transport system substrate-binding protein